MKAFLGRGWSVLLAALLLAACGGGTQDTPDTVSGADQIEPEADDAVVPAGEDGVGEPDGIAPEGDGAMVCKADCGDRVCGDDGCGGTCGHCYTLEGALDDGLCQDDGTCIQCGCGEQECGTDPCGSPCGTCPGDYVCNEQNLCEPPPIQCDFNGFHAVDEYAKLKKVDTGGFTVRYQGTNKMEPPFDVLIVEMDTALGGPPGPGEYDLAFEKFSSSGLVLYVLEGWTGEGYNAVYVPTQGTLEVLDLDPAGEMLHAVLHDVVLEEAKYNANTDAPDFVKHGKLWCMNGLGLDTSLNITKEYCVEGGTGTVLGDNIADMQLQRCDGQWVSLHDACGQVQAMWLVATAGW